MTPLQPESTIGVFGSGQLGRMFAHAAQRLGYRVHVFSPYPDSPAGQVAQRECVAPYDDAGAVAAFAEGVDVVTLEFENVPVAAIEEAARFAPVRPHGGVLHVVQHRLREKEFLREAGVPTAPYAAVSSLEGLHAAVAEIGCPAVLKTAREGYDGKGQARIDSPAGAADAWKAIGQQEAILEGFVDFACELSMLAARGLDGAIVTYGPIENAHRNHILDVSVYPTPHLEPLRREAGRFSRVIVEGLDVVGIVCVEFFATRDGGLLVNEIAPRPHNSGHLTIDACRTSQFEQQARAVCGLPFGSADLLRAAAMANLLGELWERGEPAWERALAMPGVSLHLYGKREARPGRKMGHLTALAETPAEAEELVRAAREALLPG